METLVFKRKKKCLGQYKKHRFVPAEFESEWDEYKVIATASNSVCVRCGTRAWINWWMEM
jgi:hypothetical protein